MADGVRAARVGGGGIVFIPDELERKIQELLGVKEHEGWTGVYTTREYPGAIPNGTRIKKIAEDPEGDRTPLGAEGTVLGSIMPTPFDPVGYFVEWDAAPKNAVFVVDWKIGRA